jgi:hypothetical protein
MKYTEYGLRISIDELEKLLADVKNEAKYHDKESCIYIKGKQDPTILQYSVYQECNPTNHTYGVKYSPV